MKHPYADFLNEVEKPSRYLGGEYQEARKDPAAVAARVCLAFPDVYEIGMSHLGTKILYSILNKVPEIACERAFAPWGDCEARAAPARAAGADAGVRVAAARLRRDRVLAAVRADVHERAEPARPRGAAAARRRPRRRRRRWSSAGGPTATHPEPLAPFIDAFFIGEAEETPAAAGAGGGGAAARGRPAARAPVPAGRALPAVRARALRHRGRRRDRLRRGRRAARPARAGAAQARLGRRHQPLPVPRRLAAALRGGDLRSHGGRGRARLHRGLPLLPGRHDLPPRARARSGGGDRRAGGRREEGRLRRDGADVAVDRRLLVRDAAGEDGDGASCATRRCRCRCRRCAPTA